VATGEVDVVLLDVHLHGERSEALIAECHDLHPPIPVVIVSGSADARQLAEISHADAILPKPFELDDLIATVHKLSSPQVRR